ncbi:MAG: hypothetical protein AAF604_06600 [Acidobacteriota bacterium]
MNEDRWLNQLLAEDDLPDEGFSQRVVERLGRQRQRRRRAWLLLLATLSVTLLATLSQLPGSDSGAEAGLPFALWQLVALALGAGLCAAFWLDTEAFPPSP